MKIKGIKAMGYGITIEKFDAKNATVQDIKTIKDAIHQELIVVLKKQCLLPAEFVNFGKQFGYIEEYYEEMYHHPSEKDIFVSSNMQKNSNLEGVPRTGSFWHSDYAFMKTPFAISITYPQVVPKINRGTYFIDMAKAYENLSEALKQRIENTACEHSVRKYFKIRPWDVYRPIGDIIKEIEERTPPVMHQTVTTHPITGDKILYVNEGFTFAIKDSRPESKDSQLLLDELFEASGQKDKDFSHPLIKLLEIEQGDIILWDNRRLIHHAKHTGIKEPAKTFRLTVYDENPFSLTTNASALFA